MQTRYKVGDSVVHLSHGVGTVERIDKREFGPGKTTEFYVIEIDDNGAPKKVFVPIESQAARLRPVMSKVEAAECLEIVKAQKDFGIDHQTWNRRYREYMEKIHNGSAKEIAEVVSALLALRNDKALSFGERKLLDHALTLLEKEMKAAGVPVALIAL
jgi:CarD family transcriptional regulator